MTFWSDHRNHILNDTIAFLRFDASALPIGVPPLQFPLLVLRFIESLSSRWPGSSSTGSERRGLRGAGRGLAGC
jgi:hypothetical protein